MPIFAAMFEKEIEEYERIRLEYPVPLRATRLLSMIRESFANKEWQ
jgi:hypothetical protein